MSTFPKFPPSVVFPSPHEWPETIFPIANIQINSTTTVALNGYSFSQADVNITTVMFLQVTGMTQINHLPGRIIAVSETSGVFTVDINSTNFNPYQGGGVISIVTGKPPYETQSFQTFNTPFHNIA